jgi:uncharacterized phage infection (PIP) family protein YhgE
MSECKHRVYNSSEPCIDCLDEKLIEATNRNLQLRTDLDTANKKIADLQGGIDTTKDMRHFLILRQARWVNIAQSLTEQNQQLQSDLKAARGEIAKHHDEFRAIYEIRDDLQAKNAKLKKQLKEARDHIAHDLETNQIIEDLKDGGGPRG